MKRFLAIIIFILFSLHGMSANYYPSKANDLIVNVTENKSYDPPDGNLLRFRVNSTVTIKSGYTFYVNGNVQIDGKLIIEEGASLIVNGDLTLTDNGVSTLTISSGTRLSVPGNLTNSGTINCNGRLVVGTETEGPDGTTVITSNGTITNLGTININTSDAALAKTQQDPILENSVYYAAVTCANMVNGRSTDNPLNANDKGVINMYDGSLIVQKDLTLWYRSKFYFKKGLSYLDVWGDLIQYDKYYTRTEDDAIIKLDGAGAKAEIDVRKTYQDWTTLTSNRRTHDWNLDNNQFNIDNNISLSVGHYNSNKTDYLDENTTTGTGSGNTTTPITMNVYNKEYSFVNKEKSDNQDAITAIDEQIADLNDPTSELYLSMLVIHEDDAPTAIANRIAELEAEKAVLQAKVAELDLIKQFVENNGNLTSEQISALNTWFFSTSYGQTFVGKELFIKDNTSLCCGYYKKPKYNWWGELTGYTTYNGYYTYEQYFKDAYEQCNINNLKFYHYYLAYLDQSGVNALDYQNRHNALSVMLPIELSYFEVSQSEDELSFDWATESESNNDHFTIEYSLDGNNFYSIATVDGAGNSSEQVRYRSSVSADRFGGVVYFRLRQTDFDGQSTYSETHAINVQGINERFEIYPNPATTVITISGEEFSSVVFVDSHSKTYPALSLGGGTYSVENLSRGIYFAVITTAKGTAVKEFMVTK